MKNLIKILFGNRRIIKIVPSVQLYTYNIKLKFEQKFCIKIEKIWKNFHI